MKPCCQKVIDTYLEIMEGKPRNEAALYCPECTGRIEYHEPTWYGPGEKPPVSSYRVVADPARDANLSQENSSELEPHCSDPDCYKPPLAF